MRAKVFGIVLVLLSHVNLLCVLIGLLWCFLCSDWVLRLLLFLIDDFQQTSLAWMFCLPISGLKGIPSFIFCRLYLHKHVNLEDTVS